MKKFLCAFFALMLILSASACAEIENNLVLNGDFSEIDAAGMPVHWEKDMWFTDAGVSKFYVDENGYEGNCAAIINFSDNDARFRQTIAVEPDSYYRFSCFAKASNCGEDGYGATLSIEDTFTYSNEILQSGGQWEELELYGKTGEDQTELTLLIRIGGYSMINSGSVWFDNVTAEKIDALPEGVEAQLLYRESSSSSSTSAADTNDEMPKRNTETWLLMSALYGVLILALVRRSQRLNDLKDGRKLLWIGLGVALLIRLVVAFLIRGYNTDINCFSAWSERVFANGLSSLYEADYFCDYPPGYMLLLWPVALIRNLLKLSMQSNVHIVLLKLLPILCDLLGACLIYRHAQKKRWNQALAAGLALLYAFNPAAIIDSAAWGQIDSVFTLLIALCALKAEEEKYIPSLTAFAAAMLIKPQALLFAPLGLFAIIVNLIRAKSGKKIRDFFFGVLSALGFIYALAFIACIGNAQGIIDALVYPVQWVFELYGETMGGYKYITVNALNLYTLFDLNWTSTANAPVWIVIAWILFGLAYLYSAFLYAKSGKKRLALTGALLITLIFTFGPMIHERYIFPALILLTLAYAGYRDRRLLISLTVMTVTAALNEILVLQGGMGSGNYGHLQSSEQWLNAILSIINIGNALYLSLVALDICVFDHVLPLSTFDEIPTEIETESDHRLHMRGRDYLLIAAVTLIYSIVTFVNLGTTLAPQTSWVSTQESESVIFDLGDVRDFTMIYYGGICNSTFTVESSIDGEFWSEADEAKYDQGQIFRWIFHCADGSSDPMTISARYLRITAQSAGLKLSEFGFRDIFTGELIPAEIALHSAYMEGFEGNPENLIDEQHTVPETPSYYNSSYFDEIYHARTAYELLHGEYAYEWTHPHLGKILMMLGIQIFGMTPFGWRFMGALIGVLMLPVMYLLAKQLTKSTKLSFAAMFLLAVDSMHFTQTRIATIDSYAVFWIMVMYLFMFRYAQMDWKKLSLGRTLVPLGICGVTMGVAWATKWIGIYASAGLAIIFFWKLLSELIYAGERRSEFFRRTIITIGFCLIFYIVIPVLIYYFSYYPQLRYEGVATFGDMFSSRWVKRIVELQESILGYHAGLGGDTHYFRSPWYQWPIVWWPMWYYSGSSYMPEGMVSSISCMGNPAVWWAGLIALIAVLILSAWKKRAPKNYLLVLIGFASQFLPWVLVPRSTFIYHYFASVPFIILCVSLMLGWLKERNAKAAKYTAIGLMAAALILFLAFYPLESGYPVAESYAKYLRWFKWYNY